MATITVLGLGYIGLPTAAMFATHGHTVYGYDVNKRVIDTLRGGKIHIEEPGLHAFVQSALTAGRFVPTDVVQTSDVYIVCVPSPFHHDTKRSDLSYVETATKTLVPLVKRGDLIILESTVPARTTEDVMVPILETSGLSCRNDLHVAHCPETVLPGNMIHEMAHNHRIIGGFTPEATRAARELYASFVRAEMIETDATTAEFVKLIENTYRDVNIALANELAVISRKLGIDARDAFKIANKHPRVRLHAPGPGVGGHCIPVDPWFIIEQAPQEARLMRTARAVNDDMPRYVLSLVEEAVGAQSAPRIAVLGLAYKGNVDDLRESPSFEVIRLLKERWPGAELVLNDPHVKDPAHPLVPLEHAIDGVDCILVLTDHREYRHLDPWAAAKKVRSRAVVDTRGMLDVKAWARNGFRILTV